MTTLAAADSAKALEAMLWVFASLAAVVVALFLATMALSYQHRRRRNRLTAKLDSAGRGSETSRTDLQKAVLTVGDLVADPELRRHVLAVRHELAAELARAESMKIRRPDPRNPDLG